MSDQVRQSEWQTTASEYEQTEERKAQQFVSVVRPVC